MKIFLLSAVMIIAGTDAFAQDNGYAMLRLQLSNHAPLAVNIDGKFIDRGTVSLSMDGLRSGYHRITVYRVMNFRRPLRIYTGSLRLEESTDNIGIVDVRRRMLRLKTIPMADNAGNNNQRNDAKNNDDMNGGNRHQGNNQNAGSDGRDVRPDDASREGLANESGQEGYGSYPKGRGNARREMPANSDFDGRDMDELGTRVNALVTDTEKEKLLRNEIKTRQVSSVQVRKMLSWLSFESTRLAFAKWAYNRVTDRRNYRHLEDVFSYSESKEEFKQAIGDH